MSTQPQAAPAAAVQKVDEKLWIHLLLGVAFGIFLIKSEVASWYRIQEMFRFQSIHMYGVIGSAVVVAAISLWMIKYFWIRTIYGSYAVIKDKEPSRGYSVLYGGIIFGLGWAMLGACPGPLYALIGNGVTVMIVAWLSAVAGAWIYGYLRPRLPH